MVLCGVTSVALVKRKSGVRFSGAGASANRI